MLKLLAMLRFLLRVSSTVRLSRLSIGVALAAGVASGLANTALLALINNALSRPREVTSTVIGIFFGFCLFVPLSRFLSQYLLLRLAARAMFDLREQLSRRILTVPLQQLERTGTNRLLVTLTQDVDTLSTGLANLPLIAMHLAFIAGCLAYLGGLSPRILVVIVVAMVVGVVSYRLPTRPAMRHLRQLRERNDELFEHFEGLTSGTKELKLSVPRRRVFLARMFERTVEAIRHHMVQGNALFAASATWGHILFFVVTGVVVYFVPRELPVAPSVLSGYALTLLYLRGPLTVLLNMFPEIGRALVSARKIEELGLSLAELPTEPEATEPPPPVWQRLQLLGVSHAYEGANDEERFTLGPLDLDFRPGEVVFLIGGNGSGKTTLVKLLAGLYAPDRGELRLDGMAVTDQSRDRYRQLFSAVFHDFFLFRDLPGIGEDGLDEKARGYLERLHLERKVEVRGGELSTLDLSQGQRKRLALLAAYLEDRPIYLFDEWAADQDPQFREIFYLRLLGELRGRGKTVFVISHDERYYHVADRILKLDYGKVVSDQRGAAA